MFTDRLGLFLEGRQEKENVVFFSEHHNGRHLKSVYPNIAGVHFDGLVKVESARLPGVK